MSSDRAIREAVEHLAGTHRDDKVFVIDATVDSVDITTRTCVCTAIGGKAGSELPNVRLMASIDDGLLIIPTIDSTVTLLFSNFTDPCIISYSEIDTIIFRGGDLGGLVKVIELTTKLNNLENLVNDLISKFNSHTHQVTSTGAPTGPNLLPETEKLTPTMRLDIENINVTQG